MNTFFLQSFLLLAAAYFLGAIVGCWLRKLFKKAQISNAGLREGTAIEGAIPATVAVAGGAVAGTRFQGNEREASIQINRVEGSGGSEHDVLAGVELPVVDTDISAISVPAATAVPPVNAGRETITIVEPAKRTPSISVPASKPAPVATASVQAPQAVTPATVAVPPASDRLDDLTNIKGVGLPIAQELRKLGIRRFEQVANWTDADVKAISSKLGFSGRIERENWMDQARILAAGDDLQFTAHQLERAEPLPGTGAAAPAAGSGLGAAAAAAAAATAVSTGTLANTPKGPVVDDLKLIRGIGTNLEQQLNSLGITRYAQIAAWTMNDVAVLGEKLGIEGRIEREKWVDQARQFLVSSI